MQTSFSTIFTDLAGNRTVETRSRAENLKAAKRAARTAKRVAPAPHARPYDRGGCYDQDKATQYARWLAKRDGIAVWQVGKVYFTRVWQQGSQTSIVRAEAVAFGDVLIKIPHVDYDPTQPALDLSECPQQAQHDINASVA